jgi:hypothetical protein
MKHKSIGKQITGVETTPDKITGRGGISFILRYVEKIKLFHLMDRLLGDVWGSRKGKGSGFIVRQILAKMMDGSDLTIQGFDRIGKDSGYAAALEVSQQEMLSSHTVKRFFKKFMGTRYKVYRKVLLELFVWRLNIVKPGIIVLDMDTMVLDNDDAQQREGVSVTYKKNKKGYQPIQISWEGKIVDAYFRRGSAHSNHGNDVKTIMKEVVQLIRRRYRRDVPIIVTSDSGFMDEDNFEYFENELKIHYICYGKQYETVKEAAKQAHRKGCETYRSSNALWEYNDFMSRLDSWAQERRTIYTRLVRKEQQLLLDFVRPDSVLYTNIGTEPEMTRQLQETGNREYLKAEKVIALAHGRGKSELTNRSFKEFIGKEQLPFKNFGMNGAYYYMLVIAHFLYESYKEDVSRDVVPANSYATTFRRALIDFAARIVKKGNRIMLQVSEGIGDICRVGELWSRSNDPVPLPAG